MSIEARTLADRNTSQTSRMQCGVVARCPARSVFVERRHDTRWPFKAAVSVLEPVSGARVAAHTSDFCAGGCYVDSMNPLPAGTKVQLRLTKDGQHVDADAVVGHSQVGVGMGLAFTAIAAEHRIFLDHWLAELRGELTPEPHSLDEGSEVQVASTLKRASDYALEELLVLLMRKGVVTDEEGEPVLRRLLR